MTVVRSGANGATVRVQGVPGPDGPQGTAGVDAVQKTLSTDAVKSRVMVLDVANPGKVRSIVGAIGAALARFAGIATATAADGTVQPIQHTGPIDPSDKSVGAGLATAIGWDASGNLVRVNDPTCVSGLRHAGWCDVEGQIYLRERIADRYEWYDFGLVPDWDGTTGTDNLPAMVAMLAAMKRDAIRFGSLSKIQPCHLAGYFYFSDTLHIRQGIDLCGDGKSNPWLHDGYHWSPGTQLVFPDGCHAIILHGQGEFDAMYPAPNATSVDIASVTNDLSSDVVIATTQPHNLSTGDWAIVSITQSLSVEEPGHGGAILLSGEWKVNVTGPTTFKVYDSNGIVFVQGNGDTITGRAVTKCTVPWSHDPDLASAGYSRIRDLTIYKSSNAMKSGTGILMLTRATVSGLAIENMGGDGIAIRGDHTYNGGNSNGWKVNECQIGVCGGHGLRAEGGDANAGSAQDIDLAACVGHGLFSPANLGNTFVNVQAAACGAPTEFGPFFDFYDGGTASVYVGLYSEVHWSVFKSPSLVLGGNITSPSRTDSRSTALILDGPTIARGTLRNYDPTSDGGNAVLYSYLGTRDGTGTFALWEREAPAAYYRWLLNPAHDVVYAELSGSTSSRAIGLPFSATAIRAGLGAAGVAPIYQNGTFEGEVGFNPKLHDFGTAPPVSGNRRIGDTRRNTAPSEIGSGGSKYIIRGWVCVGNAVDLGGGVYDGGTWVQDRGLTGN